MAAEPASGFNIWQVKWWILQLWPGHIRHVVHGVWGAMWRPRFFFQLKMFDGEHSQISGPVVPQCMPIRWPMGSCCWSLPMSSCWELRPWWDVYVSSSERMQQKKIRSNHGCFPWFSCQNAEKVDLSAHSFQHDVVPAWFNTVNLVIEAGHWNMGIHCQEMRSPRLMKILRLRGARRCISTTVVSHVFCPVGCFTKLRHPKLLYSNQIVFEVTHVYGIATLPVVHLHCRWKTWSALILRQYCLV